MYSTCVSASGQPLGLIALPKNRANNRGNKLAVEQNRFILQLNMSYIIRHVFGIETFLC